MATCFPMFNKPYQQKIYLQRPRGFHSCTCTHWQADRDGTPGKCMMGYDMVVCALIWTPLIGGCLTCSQ
jgi:hypothetical protein